jgi:Ku protein
MIVIASGSVMNIRFSTMPARAIGTSTIAFGLVSLPVKLYSTGESARRISFNMIHKECGTRVRQQYICPTDDVVVPREDIVKGYEFAKGQYVLFDDEELKVVEAPKSDSIDIVTFVPADRVDRLYFNKAYYLGPDKGGARAYRLLSAALRETDRVAIAKHATRGKEYLVMLRPHKEGLLMEQLFYADELRRGAVGGRRGQRGGAEAGEAAHRSGGLRPVRPDGVQGRGLRQDPRADREEDRGPGDHGRARGRIEDADHRPHGRPQGLPGRRRGGAQASDQCRKEDRREVVRIREIVPEEGGVGLSVR